MGRRRWACVVGALGVTASLVGACAFTPPAPMATTPALRCAAPGTPVWVGDSWQDDPPSRFTVTAGTYRLSARDFPPPAPVPIFPMDRTGVILGPGDTTPTYDQQRSTMSHATISVSVTKTEPAVLRLDAGSYWLVNTLGATLHLTPCDGGRISGVVPAPRARRIATPAAATTTTFTTAATATRTSPATTAAPTASSAPATGDRTGTPGTRPRTQ